MLLIGLTSIWAAGRLDWSLYVTFGAFASVYGGGRPTPGRPAAARWRQQLFLGSLLTVAVAAGVAVGISDERAGLSVPVAAAVAAGAAWLSDRYRWRPPGPMFLVFAVAACSSVPASAADLGAAVLVAGGTALLAVAIGAADARWWPGSASGQGSEPQPAAQPELRPGLQATRCAIAVLIAGVLGISLGIGHPYWAMVAAVVPLGVFGLRHQLVRGVHRAVGTLVGLGVAAVLLSLPLPDLATVLLVALLQGLTELLVARNYGLALVFITPLALLLGELADPQPVAELLTQRLGQTLIGIGVGMVIAVLTRRRSPSGH